MKLNYAKKLHNGDQVTVKGTQEIVIVIKAYMNPEFPKYYCIEVMTQDGYKVLSHLDVK